MARENFANTGLNHAMPNRLFRQKQGMVTRREREQLAFEWTGGAMHSHIVVVEDDVDQLANYSYALSKKGFSVSGYETVDEIHHALTGQPSLVLLDIHLGQDPDAGFGICRWLLDRYPGLPVIFLTSRTDEIDQIFGLRLGAWDYLTKPISTALLVEKVAAVLKRANRSRGALGPVLQDGALIVDPDRALVSFHGEHVSLTVTELAILEALLRAQGAILTYDQLAERTRQTVVTNNTLSTHIKHIRRKLKAIDADFDGLINVYGTGYRWESPPG